jgi:hypothetical protein
VCQEKAHDYLGMRIDDVRLREWDVGDAAEGHERRCSLPNHLFEVDPNAAAIDKEKAELFHHYTAKLLFLCKRARPDIQTAVAFLTTRVKGPDVDDYKELQRVMQDTCGTRRTCRSRSRPTTRTC